VARTFVAVNTRLVAAHKSRRGRAWQRQIKKKRKKEIEYDVSSRHIEQMGASVAQTKERKAGAVQEKDKNEGNAEEGSGRPAHGA
jgi:hypothetical protein